MPWDKAGYKAQLQKDLKDIRQKLSRVLGQDLDKSDNPIMEATSPVKIIGGSVLVDLCMQRSGRRGSGCDAPKSADRFPKSSDGFSKSSEGFPIPVASPPRPPTPPTAQIRQYPLRKYVNKEVCLYIRTLKPLKTMMEREEVKFKRPGSMNDDNIESDVIKHDSDVTIRDIEVNKPIARKRYAQKHSLVSKKGFLKSSSRVCSRTFTRVALMLAIVISILGGLFNIILPKRKSTIRTSSSLSPSKPRVVLRCQGYSALSILRGSAAAIISISEGLCSCIRKVIFLNDNQQLTRCMKVLQNTIIHAVTICNKSSPSSMLKTCAPYYYATHVPTTFARNVSAGKHVDVYIFPFTNFCTFRVDYLDIYTVNLESDVNFTVFYDLIYLYIYILFIVRGRPVIGQPAQRSFYILWLISLKFDCFSNKNSR